MKKILTGTDRETIAGSYQKAYLVSYKFLLHYFFSLLNVQVFFLGHNHIK